MGGYAGVVVKIPILVPPVTAVLVMDDDDDDDDASGAVRTYDCFMPHWR